MKNLFASICILTLSSLSCTVKNDGTNFSETLYVRHEGADMPAYVHGNPASNTILVAIHGSGGFGLSFRTEAFRNLEAKYKVVYFDQRGQSMSQGHFPKPDTYIDLMAKDVWALTRVLREHYGPEAKLFLLGHSLGGMVTAKALSEAGIQGEYLGWINVDGLLSTIEANYARFLMLSITAEDQILAGNSKEQWKAIAKTLEEITDPEGEDYAKTLKLLPSANKLMIKDGVVLPETSKGFLYQTLIANNPVSWFVSNIFNKPINQAVAQKVNIFPNLASISLPTLFIYGSHDLSVPSFYILLNISKLASRDHKFLKYEYSAHFPFYSEPERFSNDVIDFVDRLEGGNI